MTMHNASVASYTVGLLRRVGRMEIMKQFRENDLVDVRGERLGVLTCNVKREEKY